MTISLSTLRSELRINLGVDSTDLPDADADLLLNRTYWEILEKFHLRETESSTTLTTTASDPELSLPASFESLRISSIIDPDDLQHYQLKQISIKDYERYKNDDTENDSFPEMYVREADKILLWPTPDDEYDVVIYYRTQLADLSNANTTPDLPKSWQELLILGSVYRGFLRLNDYDKANAAKAHYIGTLNSMVPVESKEEWDTSTAGVRVLGREY